MPKHRVSHKHCNLITPHCQTFALVAMIGDTSPPSFDLVDNIHEIAAVKRSPMPGEGGRYYTPVPITGESG
jgi:hypothetical protein